jgi:hypothetical protein
VEPRQQDADHLAQMAATGAHLDAATEEALAAHTEMVKPSASLLGGFADGLPGVQLERASVAAPRPELDWTRDWQGRPRILPDPTWPAEKVTAWQDGRANDQGEVAYTRVTTFAEALQDASALARWKLRRAVLGMGRRPDYVTTAASLTTEDRDRDALDDLAEKALEAAGPNAADVGTALHAFTERIDRGEPLGFVPEEYRAGLEAYQRVVSHLTFVEFECRTVCDELETAGTPDRVGFCDVPDPDGVTDALRMIDTKTGRVDYSAGKFSTQLAIYWHSDLYHPGTGVRTSWEAAHGVAMSRWGLIIHMPAGAQTAELLWIDLEHGWRGAREALTVRQWRAEAKADRLLLPVFARAPRPATTDGTCRGRKADGKACGYRAKKVDGELTAWCGRHQDQQKDLERWLAENPGVDPASGEAERPAMDPVQPSLPPVDREESRATIDAALSGALGVKVTSNWAGIDAAEAALNATPEQAAALTELAAGMVESGEADTEQEAEELVAMAPAVEEESPARELTGPHGYPLGSIAEAAEADQWEHYTTGTLPPVEEHHPRELNASPGTYALDRDSEQNGNRRPQSTLTDEEAVADAGVRAHRALLDQVAGAQSDSELTGIWQRYREYWTPELNQAAAARSAQMVAERQRARPEAALLAAIATARDRDTLTDLWGDHSHSPLWTPQVHAAMSARWRELS